MRVLIVLFAIFVASLAHAKMVRVKIEATEATLTANVHLSKKIDHVEIVIKDVAITHTGRHKLPKMTFPIGMTLGIEQFGRIFFRFANSQSSRCSVKNELQLS